jgi:hypothetical protein
MQPFQRSEGKWNNTTGNCPLKMWIGASEFASSYGFSSVRRSSPTYDFDKCHVMLIYPREPIQSLLI